MRAKSSSSSSSTHFERNSRRYFSLLIQQHCQVVQKIGLCYDRLHQDYATRYLEVVAQNPRRQAPRKQIFKPHHPWLKGIPTLNFGELRGPEESINCIYICYGIIHMNPRALCAFSSGPGVSCIVKSRSRGVGTAQLAAKFALLGALQINRNKSKLGKI